MSKLDEALNQKSTNGQAAFSLQEMRNQFGSVAVGHQTMKRSDGTEFDAYGLQFGKGQGSCFVAFSGRIANEDQSKRDPQFKGLNGVEIGKKVWAQKSEFQVLHKMDTTTGEMLYRQNGEPIYTICHYNDFTKVDAELD